ncbi:heat shock factor protein 4 [Bombina bombina]|uniref:heat shock factor protein 4 n=1 Tax=Bombina bombina TaxID=8345 RepID=UPI00235A4EC3|nr:heat shock factor protein 4 [Bombina bombina]
MQESASSLAMDGYCSNVPAFLTKLWTLVEDPDTNHLICWSVNGTSFHVFDQGRFAKEVLPKYFKHNNMASFVRQLNMYGFRKVVNIEQGGLVKPERDDTEFQHLYFLQGHEHLLEHIKRKVSVVKSEETKLRHEDVSRLLYEVQTLRGQQENTECQMQDMKQQNEVLWREVVSLRQNHSQQQKIINKLIQFLFGQLPPGPTSTGIKRKIPLMLDDGNSTLPLSKFSRHMPVDSLPDPYYIQSPSADSTPPLISPAVSAGPIISDVTETSPPALTNVSPTVDGERSKCLMLIKEEPISPGVKGSTEPDVSLNNCATCSDPPVLPVAMVQSILEGKESCNPPQPSGSHQLEGQCRRNPLERIDMPDPLDCSDVSLESLQLLLRSQHYNLDTTTVMDVFNTGLCVSEWSLPTMDSTLLPMQQLSVDLEKNVNEVPRKGLNPPFNHPCPEMVNLAGSSSIFGADESVVSYLSSGVLSGDGSLNLHPAEEQND